ncbi:tetratricopeptide repeat protein [Flavobacteriaceae bacterium 3-367]
MKTVISIFLLVMVWCPSSQAQNSKMDSLTTIWEDTMQPDSLRYRAGMDILKLQFRQNLDTARATGYKVLRLAENSGNPKWRATAHRYIGNSYAVQGNFRAALDAFQESHRLLLQLDDKKGLSTTSSNIGTVYYELGNYPEAIEHLLEGLKLAEELNDRPGISRATNNLGNVFIRQLNNEKALEYYTYSLSIKKELGDKRAQALTYNNIGLVYTNQKKYALALENLMKSVEIAEEVNDKMSMTRAFSNIGEVYNLQGDFSKALDYFNGSVRIKMEINDREGLASVYLYRGRSYLYQKNYRQAQNDCEKSLQLSMDMGALPIQKSACSCLSSAWEGLGNASKSLEYYKRYVTVSDSLFTREKTAEITRQEMQYLFEKQQLSDSIAFHKQRAEQEVLFEKDLSKQRNLFNLVVFGGLGLLLLGGIYWQSRQKSKKLDRERTMVARLKQVDQLKDQFLANTSHELRTPLNGIIGLTESLKDGVAGALPPKAHENLDMIANSGKRLSHLVNDILDFSKLKNRDLVLALQPLDIRAAVDVVLKLSEPFVQRKPIKFVNAIPKDIPLVEADENRLQQILHNLIGNAIKFTEKGSITVDAKEIKGMLSISVSDTGIGIPGEKLERIFKQFEQVDGRIEREYGGTGLGLSVTKQLVELHKGNIEVTSTLGKGSTFRFTLPKSNKSRENIEPVEALGQEKISTVQADVSREGTTSLLVEIPKNVKGFILIVDDEPVNRRVLENHLTVAGYRVTEVSSGPEALALLQDENPFDLVLLDVMMPGMSGFEVCEAIRANYMASELPVVLLTAKNRVSDLVSGFNVGANDYLTKPFSKNELLSRIKTHLNLNGIHRASSKFVPTEFLKSVGREAITDVELGDHIEKEVTVLFSDIRNYTQLAESMTPRQNFKFVNAYVGKMGPLIQQNKGFVNQYLGDGIMALFPHEAAHALQAAIDMQKAVTEYNVRRVKEGFVPISVGMGLHTGPLVMGIIGDVNRNDTAIIADTVNTASRMEGVTKYYGAQLILSEDSLKTIENKDAYNFRYLGMVRVKGKDKAIGIYECFDGDPTADVALKIKTLKEFNKGLEHFFKNEFPKAAATFDRVLGKNPRDRVAKYFVTKSAEYTIAGTPEDWDVVNTLDQK